MTFSADLPIRTRFRTITDEELFKRNGERIARGRLAYSHSDVVLEEKYPQGSRRDERLNRVLAVTPCECGGHMLADPTAHVAEAGGRGGIRVVPALPRVLHGSDPALAIEDLAKFGIGGGDEGAEVVPAGYRPAAGAEYPNGVFGRSMRQIAQLIKADVGVEIAFADIGGWDTHQAQGGEEGQLPRRLAELALGIRAFHDDLGDRMEDVVVLTMSEFGRTVAENGSGGTDHGHANCMLVLGGPVRGGRVLGEWPGLEQEQLYEGRGLALTTDFRDVSAEVVGEHLGATKLEEVFPGFSADHAAQRGLFR